MRHLILIAAILPLAACGGANPRPVTTPTTAPGQQVGAANPASVYCGNLGGQVRMRGQTGYCHLPDGAVHEEWSLYRANTRL